MYACNILVFSATTATKFVPSIYFNECMCKILAAGTQPFQKCMKSGLLRVVWRNGYQMRHVYIPN